MPTPSRRHAAPIVLSLALAGALSACAGGSTSGDSATAGVSNLTMWTFLDPKGDDPRGAALAKIVSGFNAANPQTHVEVTSINFAKIDGEVIRAAATGGGPDIVNIYSVQLAQHVQGGSIQPITAEAKPWLAKQGANYVFPIDNVTYNNDIMALPWESRVWLLWYRKDLLAKYGVTPPTTLEELRTSAAAISKASNGTVAGIGIGMSEQGLGADFMEKFEPLTTHFGGSLFDKSGKAAFDSDAGTKALQYISSLAATGGLTRSALTQGADDVVNAVKTGSAAMAIEGSFRVAAARKGDGVGANLVTAPFPGDASGNPTPTAVAGQTLAMGANTKDRQGVWNFMQYYLSENSQEAFAQAGVMPVLSPAFDKVSDTAAVNRTEMATWRDYLSKHSTAARYPASYSELSTQAVKAAQTVVFGDQSAATALKGVAAAYNAAPK